MVNSFSRLLVGVSCVLGFVIISDTRDIYLESLIKIGNPFDYVLIVFGMTVLFYTLTNLVKKKEYQTTKAVGFVSSMLWLNVVTAGNWLGWFLSLKYLTAPTVVALYGGIITIATLVVNRLLRPTSITSKADWVSAILLISCAMAWAIVNVISFQGVQTAIGISLVVMSSFSIATTTVISKQLADINIPARKIMAHRFYILIAIAFCMSSSYAELFNVVNHHYQELLLAGSIGTVLCLWLLQKGIERCEPVLTVVIISTSPAFSLALYFTLIGGALIDRYTLLMSVFVVLIAVFHVLLNHRYKSIRSST